MRRLLASFAIILLLALPRLGLAAADLNNAEKCPTGTVAQCTCKPGFGQKEEAPSTACDQGICCANRCGGADEVKKFECATGEEPAELLPLTPPDLQVEIPGFPSFTENLELDDDKKFYSVPWIAEYINAIYRWGVGIAAVLAVIMIIIGGFTWLTAGGNSQQVETAKTYIIGALTGLILAMGSYTILWLINPELTLLKPLRIPYVERVSLELVTYEDKTLPSPGSGGKPLSATDYDADFQRMSACAGIDWRATKAIASKESGLSADIVNSSGFVGLMQVHPKYCSYMLQQMSIDEKYCLSPGLKDPAVNIAAANGQFKVILQHINTACSSATAKDKAYMLYFGHSSGPGALKYALNRYGCTTGQWASKYQQEPDKNVKPVFYFFKGATADYVEATAQLILAQGVTNIQAASGSCDTSIKTDG